MYEILAIRADVGASKRTFKGGAWLGDLGFVRVQNAIQQRTLAALARTTHEEVAIREVTWWLGVQGWLEPELE